ncbi:MAG: nitrophenyl compound nitroreductase subunit ArsF family protein [Elusimicrobia bacterium]|nr:nitrophenyl compound nitroreductase subunit ArsF family protein [Candidatus Obscuribacterium magneticum]
MQFKRRSLLLFIGLLAGLLAATQLSFSETKKSAPRKTVQSEEKTDKKSKNGAASEQRKIIVYYFHGKFRCLSCRKIEATTEESVKSFFADDLIKGKVEYRVVNVEEKGNEHFVQDYQLYTKSVVVVDTLKGKEIRWKNLAKVWPLLSDEGAFKTYIRDEVRFYQKGE